jgi:hypothetical protein
VGPGVEDRYEVLVRAQPCRETSLSHETGRVLRRVEEDQDWSVQDRVAGLVQAKWVVQLYLSQLFLYSITTGPNRASGAYSHFTHSD